MTKCTILPTLAALASRLSKIGFAYLLMWAACVADGAELQTLKGHVPAAVKSLAATGRLPATTQLNLAIGLPLRNTAALSNLLQQVYDPASSNFRHYLTPAEFAEQFGPTEQDYEAVIAFAKANHLQVTALHPNRMLVDVSGSVADIEKALHVNLRTYPHPTEKRSFYAPDSEPSLSLDAPVLHVSGLDNYTLPRSLSHKMPALRPNAVPAAGSAPNGAYMGKDFRAAYAPNVTLTGTGQSVGLVQFNSGFYQSDITAYETAAGLPNVPIQPVLLDSYGGGPGTGNIEVSLDIEMVISMAPGLSKVYVFEGNITDDILNSMAASNQVEQLSASWSYSVDATTTQIYQEFQAQGQSFFNASGDSDAYTGTIPSPCDNPYITIVGGTTLTMNGTGTSYSSEKVWNEVTENGTDGVGSSGGISTQYTIPSWQTNISMVANQGSTSMRNIPDVAMTADNVWVIHGGNGSAGAYDGTSCATPLWAGFAALVNQQAANNKLPPIGFINPALDAIGTGASYYSCFHDIFIGNNTWSASPSQFYAAAGYDLCTGWGTPAGQSLINALSSPEPLQISPSTNLIAIGPVGGPFFPASLIYSLTNSGTSTLSWTLSNAVPWLNVSPIGGTLVPGGPLANVTLSFNAATSNLMAGSYSAILWFTNQSDGVGQSRSVTLSLIKPPVITLQPTNEAVLQGATTEFCVQVTGGSPLAFQWQLNGTNLTDGGNISGSTATNLVITGVSPTDVGTYTFVATNFAGVAASSNATLTIVSSAPVITLQPTNQTAYLGSLVQFAVGVIGTTPFSYQWSFAGTNLLNATNATLTLTNVQLDQSGNYAVLITNLYGSTNSAVAVLTVNMSLPCDPLPAGAVAWWRAENNALDTIATNNGTLMNGTGFTNGEVGTAFNLGGSGTYVVANPSSPANLNVGGIGLTFEGWIKPANTGTQMPVFEYERTLGSGNGADAGMFLYINLPPGGGAGAGSIDANILDTNYDSHTLNSPANVLTAGVWQHVALTYDHVSGMAAIYFNGSLVAQANLGSFIPLTSFTNLLLGARTLYGSAASPSDKFVGDLDELTLYSRSLSSNEIATIYLAGSDGKCFTPTPPVITSQPTNQTTAVGGAASFTVIAGGSPTLTYQWSFDGTNLLNATNATLSLTNVQLNQSGNYAVMVVNAYGATNSTNALLSVYGMPPFITSQPSSQTNFVGGIVILSAMAGGTPPLTYQWSFDGTNLLNATNATLTLTNVQLDQSGNYAVLITNLYGSTNSAVAVLTVNMSLPCDPLPAGAVAWWRAENNALDTIATNNGTLMNGTGFTNGEVGTAFNLGGSGTYVVANPSSPANLNVGGIGLTFEGWIKPANTGTQMPVFEYERTLGSGNGADAGMFLYINLPPGGGAGAGSIDANILDTNYDSHTLNSPANVLTAGVWQHVALTYDHVSGMAAIYFNGSLVAQANLGSFIPLTSFTNLLLGARTLYGSAASPSDKFVGDLDELTLYSRSLSSNEIATIYLAGSDGKCFTPTPPVITSQPTNQTTAVGGAASFTVIAGGSPTLTYQWSFDGTNLLNATNATLSLTNVQLNQSGNYAVMVVNAYGATNSTNAVLIIQIPPTITSQPTNQTVPAGGTATFSVTASGGQPLSYGWSFNNTTLIGATNATLTLTNVQLTNAGNYLVKVSNSFGSATSSVALLTVQAPPLIMTQPTNLTVFVGNTAVFSTTVSGSSPLGSQWSFNSLSNIIAGATNSILTISNVQLTNAGIYTLTATNAFGAAVSSNATLTVIDTLDHFTWSSIPSPRFVNVPFNVSIQAMDSINKLFTNFAGTVALTPNAGVPASPSISGNFTQGIWSGSMTVQQTITNLILQANDGEGHVGFANSINIVATPTLGFAQSGGSLLIFWPSYPAGFVLEASGNLMTTQWMQMPSPIPIGDEELESIQMSGTNQYYRLRFTLP